MIFTLTLNPALDKNMFLPCVKKGITNRILRQVVTVGGKGTHVSMNLSQMHVANCAFGVAHGATGQMILTMLEESGVKTSFLEFADGESRTNYILIEESGVCTTIAEKGPALSENDLAQILDLMNLKMADGDTLVLSGDVSNCPGVNVYNWLAEHLTHQNLKICLDASGDSLKKGLEFQPFLIKPNEDELEALCGFEMKTDEDVLRGIELISRSNIRVVAVSLGARGSIVGFGSKIYKAIAPQVPIQNTAGCGDSFLASLLCGFERNLSYPEMLRYATAVSSATAASSLSVGYSKSFADSLMQQVQIIRLK